MEAAVTADEAATLLEVSRATITRLLQKGELKGYKLTTAPNSPIRIYTDSIDELIQRRQYQPTDLPKQTA